MVSGYSLSGGRQAPAPSMQGPKMSLPISFYVTCLVCNVMLIALYAVQVYSPHQTCIVNGKNITHHFDLAFRLGFAILIADFFNLNVVSLLTPSADQDLGHSSSFNERQTVAITRSVVLDWLIKGLTLVVSGLQYLVVSSKKSLFCSQTMDTLEFESKWLAALVVAQLIKTTAVTLWQSYLTLRGKPKKYESMFTEEDLSAYHDIEYAEDDLQAFDLEHMTASTEMSIDQLVEKITVPPGAAHLTHTRNPDHRWGARETDQ